MTAVVGLQASAQGDRARTRRYPKGELPYSATKLTINAYWRQAILHHSWDLALATKPAT